MFTLSPEEAGHACSHVELGPHRAIRATTDIAAVPIMDRTHTHYVAELDDAGDDGSAFIGLRLAPSAATVVLFDAAARLVAIATDGSLVCPETRASSPACAALPDYEVFAASAAGDIVLRLGPTPSARVNLVVERKR